VAPWRQISGAGGGLRPSRHARELRQRDVVVHQRLRVIRARKDVRAERLGEKRSSRVPMSIASCVLEIQRFDRCSARPSFPPASSLDDEAYAFLDLDRDAAERIPFESAPLSSSCAFGLRGCALAREKIEAHSRPRPRVAPKAIERVGDPGRRLRHGARRDRISEPEARSEIRKSRRAGNRGGLSRDDSGARHIDVGPEKTRRGEVAHHGPELRLGALERLVGMSKDVWTPVMNRSAACAKASPFRASATRAMSSSRRIRASDDHLFDRRVPLFELLLMPSIARSRR